MILPGHKIISQAILRGLHSPHHQIQPCGIDLSLKTILQWKTPGEIDFDNSQRKPATTEEIHFEKGRLHVPQGAYLVQFNEIVSVPEDVMGEIFVRSSLFRSGVAIHAGLVDSGYCGSIGGLSRFLGVYLTSTLQRVAGAMLQVLNPHGFVLHENSRLAQFICHEMKEKARKIPIPYVRD